MAMDQVCKDPSPITNKRQGEGAVVMTSLEVSL